MIDTRKILMKTMRIILSLIREKVLPITKCLIQLKLHGELKNPISLHKEDRSLGLAISILKLLTETVQEIKVELAANTTGHLKKCHLLVELAQQKEEVVNVIMPSGVALTNLA